MSGPSPSSFNIVFTNSSVTHSNVGQVVNQTIGMNAVVGGGNPSVAATLQPTLRDDIKVPAKSGDEKVISEDLYRKLDEAQISKVDKKLPLSFLATGLARASAVVRIDTANSYGTGFAITDDLLLTNNHVLPNAKEAKVATARFHLNKNNHFLDKKLYPETVVQLDPDICFFTSAELDFTIVGFMKPPVVCTYHPIPLVLHPLPKSDRRMYIIQHPGGREKELSLHGNRKKEEKAPYIWYSNDTEPGSSGSPVFDSEWNLVALHHRSVPKTDDQNKWLKKNGEVYNSEKDNFPDDVWFIANEAVLITSIVQCLKDSADPVVKNEKIRALIK